MCWQWAADASLERAASLAEGGNPVQGQGAELRACALRCARRQTLTRARLDVGGDAVVEVLSVPLLHGSHASSTLAVLQVVAPRNPLGRLHSSAVNALAALAALGAVGLEHCLVHVRTAAIMRDCLRISAESTLELGMHATASTVTTACARALEAQRATLWLCTGDTLHAVSAETHAVVAHGEAQGEAQGEAPRFLSGVTCALGEP